MYNVRTNIKRILNKKGYKQKYIARKAGYSENTMSNIINNRKRINDSDILRIAQALEVTPNDLFGFNSNDNSFS